MGARAIGPEVAKSIVDVWLASEFDPAGSSAENVKAIDKLDLQMAILETLNLPLSELNSGQT